MNCDPAHRVHAVPIEWLIRRCLLSSFQCTGCGRRVPHGDTDSFDPANAWKWCERCSYSMDAPNGEPQCPRNENSETMPTRNTFATTQEKPSLPPSGDSAALIATCFHWRGFTARGSLGTAGLGGR